MKQDLTGIVFSRLTVIKYLMLDKHNKRVWECRCVCGKITNVPTGALTSGNTNSCGCYHRDKTITAALIHGQTRNRIQSKEYQAWGNMIQRCYNPKQTGYKDYGGRGITVCDRWLYSFQKFLEDMGMAPSTGHSIDRIEYDEGYFKGNCRWATRKEQNNNNRRNVILTCYGKSKNIAEWAEFFGVPYTSVYYHHNAGKDAKQIYDFFINNNYKPKK